VLALRIFWLTTKIWREPMPDELKPLVHPMGAVLMADVAAVLSHASAALYV
jgi:hypothetical protein